MSFPLVTLLSRYLMTSKRRFIFLMTGWETCSYYAIFRYLADPLVLFY